MRNGRPPKPLSSSGQSGFRPPSLPTLRLTDGIALGATPDGVPVQPTRDALDSGYDADLVPQQPCKPHIPLANSLTSRPTTRERGVTGLSSRPSTQGGRRDGPSGCMSANHTLLHGVEVDSWPARSSAISWTVDGPGTIHSKHSGNTPKPPLLTSLEVFVSRELAMLPPGDIDGRARLRIHREALLVLAEHFRHYGTLISTAVALYDLELERCRRDVARLQEGEKEGDLRELVVADRTRTLEHQLSRLVKDAEETTKEQSAMLSATQQSYDSATDRVHALESEVRELKEEKQRDLTRMLALIRAVKEADVRLRSHAVRIATLSREVEKMDELKMSIIEAQKQLSQLHEAHADIVPRKTHDKIVKDLEARLARCEEDERKSRRMCVARGVQFDKATRLLNQLVAERELYKRGAGSVTPRPGWQDIQETLRQSVPEFQTDNLETTIAWSDALVQRLKYEREERMRGQAELARLQTNEGPVSPVATSSASAIATAAATLMASSMGSLTAAAAKHALLQGGGAAGAGSPNTASSSNLTVATPTNSGSYRLSSVCVLGPIPGNTAGSFAAVMSKCVGCTDRAELTRKDMALMLHNFWEFRRHQRVSQPDIVVSLTTFATQRFGAKKFLDRMVNLVETTRKFRGTDSRCELFLGVLDGVMPERLHEDTAIIVDKLRRAVVDLATVDRRRVRKAAVMETVGPYLNHKATSALDALRLALGRDTTIDVDELVQPAHPFMDTLWQQGADENIELYSRLVQAFTAAAVPCPPAPGTNSTSTTTVAPYIMFAVAPPVAAVAVAAPPPLAVTVDSVEDIVARIEPDTPATEVESLCRDAVELVPAGGVPARFVLLSSVLEKLSTVKIIRLSPPSDSGPAA